MEKELLEILRIVKLIRDESDDVYLVNARCNIIINKIMEVLYGKED